MVESNKHSLYPDPEPSEAQRPPWSGGFNVTPGILQNQNQGTYQSPYKSVASAPSNAIQNEENVSHKIPLEVDEEDEDEDMQMQDEESEESDFLEEMESDDEISDADSEDRDFRRAMGRFKDDVRQLRTTTDTDNLGTILPGVSRPIKRLHQQTRRRKGPGVHRGPRRAVEPTPDIKRRLYEANMTYTNGNLELAKAQLLEIIRINAETYGAWVTLAAVLQDEKNLEGALSAKMYACHLRHRVVDYWIECADFVLDNFDPLTEELLQTAQFLLAAAVRANPKQLKARYRKAQLHAERGKYVSAISEYKLILSRSPHNTYVLSQLASVCIDHGEYQTAIDLYKETIAYFRNSVESASNFSWDDVYSYVALYECAGQLEMAIKEARSLSRWLVDRGSESFWDAVTDNDCEWDIDDQRRVKVPGFTSTRYGPERYGLGLPLEIRVKLGLLRLQLGHNEEAMNHLKCLDPSNESGQNKISDHAELFEQAADQLFLCELYEEAIQFYQPLSDAADNEEPSLLIKVGKCCLKLSQRERAEELFKSAIKLDEDDTEARMELARMYEGLEKPQQAYNYVNEVMLIRKHQKSRKGREPKAPTVSVKRGPARTRISRKGEEPPEVVLSQAERLKVQYQILKKEHEKMREGDFLSTLAWLDAAKDLTDDFRSFKTFYPWDKYVRFLGYSNNSSKIRAETSLDSDLSAMADRLGRGLGYDAPEKIDAAKLDLPKDYRGIDFRNWLNIFVEYALCLARTGESKEAYDVCEAVTDAIIWYKSREDMFLVHLAWCLCALMASDEETCVTVCRFFMKEYQFTTDSYRLFAALSRVCQSPVSWYSSGPSQKYILRQIKVMDYALVTPDMQEQHYADMGSYQKDENGRNIVNTDMDVQLLMLYGHILYTGTSYSYALNYFFRAYALDPGNPVIHLSIGLAYIHHSLKRQAENRQHQIVQGLTFMKSYYDSRALSLHLEERQEAHYNMARTYHMLGLTHLAIPYYLKVLDEVSDGEQRSSQEDVVFDTAYNLQTIYSMAGNATMAEDITKRFLLI